MTPTVTVIIPTHNVASLLPEAIASVRAQQWPNLEIIVVDDGSTDDTESVLNALAGDGDLRWFRQQNAGAAAARNRAIRESTGDWIAFLDADDFWLPDKLAIQMGELEEYSRAGFSYTDVRLQFINGAESDWKSDPADSPLLLKLLAGNFFGTPSAIVRRQCFQEVGLFDEELRTGEDWDMWLRLAAHFESLYVPRPLTLVRKTAHQTKIPVSVLEQCTLRVLDRLFACPRIQRQWPDVAAKRRLVYAWHYSVLAKSYLRQKLIRDFARLTLRAIGSHPLALRYMAQRRQERLES